MENVVTINGVTYELCHATGYELSCDLCAFKHDAKMCVQTDDPFRPLCVEEAIRRALPISRTYFKRIDD